MQTVKLQESVTLVSHSPSLAPCMQSPDPALLSDLEAEYPPEYFDAKAMRKVLAASTGKHGNVQGIPWHQLKHDVPLLRCFIKDQKAQHLKWQPSHVQEAILASKIAQATVPTKHVKQWVRDLASILGIYYAFLRRFEGKGLILMLFMLWDSVRLKAFFMWCNL